MGEEQTEENAADLEVEKVAAAGRQENDSEPEML